MPVVCTFYRWECTHFGLAMLRLGSKRLLPVVSASLTTQMSEMKMKGAMMARAAVACQLRDATSPASEGHMHRQVHRRKGWPAGAQQHCATTERHSTADFKAQVASWTACRSIHLTVLVQQRDILLPKAAVPASGPQIWAWI